MSKVVEEIREKIDTLDNKVHDLLMERAELVLKIGEEKRKNQVQVVQPDREIVMLRRLLARHKGPLPKEAVVRIWRELVGAVSLLQTGLKVAVTVPDDQTGLIYWDMAKDYFSSVLPMQKAANALSALSLVREGEVTFAVLPWPSDGETQPWWSFLMGEAPGGKVKPMKIIARLPLGNRSSKGGNPMHQALVVARMDFETSGDDRSFIALKLLQSVSRARIIDRIKEQDLEALSLYSSPHRSGQHTLHMLEVSGYVGAQDERLKKFAERLDDPEALAIVVGGYPNPPVYDDKVGKNAVGDAPAAATTKKSA
jgi:chorismate mutase-like protein